MIIELKDKGLKLSFPDDMDEKEIERQISSQIYDQDMISSQNPSTFDKIKDTVNQNIPEFLQGDSAPTPDTPQPVVNPEQTVPVTQRATDLYKSGLESDTFKEPIANAVDSIDTEKRAMSYAPYMAVKAVKGAMGPFLSPLNFLGMDTEGTLNTAIEYWQNKVPEVGIPNAGIVFDENGDLDIQQIDDMPLSEILGGVAEGTGFLAPAATALKAGGLVSSLATSARPFYQSILKGMVGGSLLGGGEKDATLESMAMFGVFEGAGFAIGELPNLVKNVKNSNAYRTATIKERGLVIQDLEQTIKNNPDMSQYDLVKASDYYFKEAVKRSQNLESVNPFENTNAPASKTGLLKPDKPVVDNRTGGMSVETLKNVKDPNIRALTEKELKPIDQALIEDDVASIDFAFDNIVKEMQQTPEPAIETLDAVFNRNNIPQQARPVEPIVEQLIDNRTGGMSIEDINNRQYQAVTEPLPENIDATTHTMPDGAVMDGATHGEPVISQDSLKPEIQDISEPITPTEGNNKLSGKALLDSKMADKKGKASDTSTVKTPEADGGNPFKDSKEMPKDTILHMGQRESKLRGNLKEWLNGNVENWTWATPYQAGDPLYFNDKWNIDQIPTDKQSEYTALANKIVRLGDKKRNRLKDFQGKKSLSDFSKTDLNEEISYSDMQIATGWRDVVKNTPDGQAPVGVERIFFRIGKPPSSGKSYNRMSNSYEAGVSAYITPIPGSLAGDIERPVYYGKGKQVAVGGDGEPVIEITGKWKKFPSPNQSSTPGEGVQSQSNSITPTEGNKQTKAIDEIKQAEADYETALDKTVKVKAYDPVANAEYEVEYTAREVLKDNESQANIMEKIRNCME